MSLARRPKGIRLASLLVPASESMQRALARFRQTSEEVRVEDGGVVLQSTGGKVEDGGERFDVVATEATTAFITTSVPQSTLIHILPPEVTIVHAEGKHVKVKTAAKDVLWDLCDAEAREAIVHEWKKGTCGCGCNCPFRVVAGMRLWCGLLTPAFLSLFFLIIFMSIWLTILYLPAHDGEKDSKYWRATAYGLDNAVAVFAQAIFWRDIREIVCPQYWWHAVAVGSLIKGGYRAVPILLGPSRVSEAESPSYMQAHLPYTIARAFFYVIGFTVQYGVPAFFIAPWMHRAWALWFPGGVKPHGIEHVEEGGEKEGGEEGTTPPSLSLSPSPTRSPLAARRTRSKRNSILSLTPSSSRAWFSELERDDDGDRASMTLVHRMREDAWFCCGKVGWIYDDLTLHPDPIDHPSSLLRPPCSCCPRRSALCPPTTLMVVSIVMIVYGLVGQILKVTGFNIIVATPIAAIVIIAAALWNRFRAPRPLRRLDPGPRFLATYSLDAVPIGFGNLLAGILIDFRGNSLVQLGVTLVYRFVAVLAGWALAVVGGDSSSPDPTRRRPTLLPFWYQFVIELITSLIFLEIQSNTLSFFLLILAIQVRNVLTQTGLLSLLIQQASYEYRRIMGAGMTCRGWRDRQEQRPRRRIPSSSNLAIVADRRRGAFGLSRVRGSLVTPLLVRVSQMRAAEALSTVVVPLAIIIEDIAISTGWRKRRLLTRELEQPEGVGVIAAIFSFSLIYASQIVASILVWSVIATRVSSASLSRLPPLHPFFQSIAERLDLCCSSSRHSSSSRASPLASRRSLSNPLIVIEMQAGRKKEDMDVRDASDRVSSMHSPRPSVGYSGRGTRASEGQLSAAEGLMSLERAAVPLARSFWWDSYSDISFLLWFAGAMSLSVAFWVRAQINGY